MLYFLEPLERLQVGKQAHARTAAVQEAEQDSDSLSERIKKLKEKCESHSASCLQA